MDGSLHHHLLRLFHLPLLHAVRGLDRPRIPREALRPEDAAHLLGLQPARQPVPRFRRRPLRRRGGGAGGLSGGADLGQRWRLRAPRRGLHDRRRPGGGYRHRRDPGGDADYRRHDRRAPRLRGGRIVVRDHGRSVARRLLDRSARRRPVNALAWPLHRCVPDLHLLFRVEPDGRAAHPGGEVDGSRPLGCALRRADQAAELADHADPRDHRVEPLSRPREPQPRLPDAGLRSGPGRSEGTGDRRADRGDHLVDRTRS